MNFGAGSYNLDLEMKANLFKAFHTSILLNSSGSSPEERPPCKWVTKNPHFG